MAFTNVQTKLSKALVTNTAGDYALRTVMDGEQDLNGEYLLNEQTTTNMMSKGTVYRFDGDDDVITVTDSAEIQNIFDNGGYLQAEIYPLSDGENDLGHIVAKRGGSNVWTWEVSAESAGFVKLTLNYSFSGTDMVASTGAVIPIGEQSKVGVCFTATAGEVPVFYLNGIAISSTATTSTGTRTTDVGANLFFGSYNGTFGVFDGEIGEVMLGNFSPTSSEIKSLISANLPAKWQYGSQVDILSGWDFTSGWSVQGGGAIDDATTFSSVGAGGISTTANILEIGKDYRITFASDDQTCAIRNGGTEVIGTGDGTYEFTAIATTLYLRLAATGTVNVTTLEVVALGAVALYTQNSMNKEAWVDLANGNDGVITGCELLNISEGQAVNSLVLTPTTVPAAGYEGEIRYNTATNKLNVWTGAAWEAVTSA